MLEKIKKYFKKVFAGERFGRLFKNLADGNLIITTNDFLRWSIFIGTTVFLLTYLDLRMDYYIKANINILKDIETARVSNIDLYHTIMEYADILELNINMYGIPDTTFSSLGEYGQISYIIFMQKLMLQGLSIEAFGIILQVISLIRLIILSIRFNVPTGIVMATISYLASYIYYMDLIYQLKLIAFDELRLIYGFAYNTKLTKEILNISVNYYQRQRSLFAPVQKLIGTFFDTSKYKVTNEYMEFRNKAEWQKYFSNDPVSMFARYLVSGMEAFSYGVGHLPKFLHLDKLRFLQPYAIQLCSYMLATYYYIGEHIVLPTLRFVLGVGFQQRFFIVYIYLVRKGKEWVPYLIRWHWQFMIIIEPLQTFHISIIKRIGKYVRAVLKPNYRSAQRDLRIWHMFQKRDTPPLFWEPHQNALQAKIDMAGFKLELAYTCQYFLLLVFISAHVYGALHAVCGQYFFIPLFTQNTELHAGYRDTLSVYSGGLTAWQDLDDSNRWRKMWHGVLGRGTDNAPIILIIFDFIKNLLVKLFRFFKR